jgi:hypothetical protein
MTEVERSEHVRKSFSNLLNKDTQNKYTILDDKLNKLKNTQTTKDSTTSTTFHPKIVNNTNITFSTEQLTLHNKGIKYNLHFKHKNWITTLAFEAEAAIDLIPPSEQEPVRYQVTNNIHKRYTQYNKQRHHNTHNIKEKKLINQITENLRSNNTIISKADKGNSMLISRESYQSKIQNFINNKFTSTEKDYTNKYLKDIRNTINKCPNLIHRDKKWKLINLNPSSPAIRGLIKIHKMNTQVRPIVNWREATAYKLAKKLMKDINNLIPPFLRQEFYPTNERSNGQSIHR